VCDIRQRRPDATALRRAQLAHGKETAAAEATGIMDEISWEEGRKRKREKEKERERERKVLSCVENTITHIH
jgi:hypothetical protein